MWEGNNGHTLQAPVSAVTAQSPSYADNRERILVAQGEDAEAADRAMNELLEANAGLIRTVALRFRERGVDYEDLYQIGTIGLIKAVRNFDVARGNCFSTYAVPLIFGEIRRHLRDEGPMKVGRQIKRLGAALMAERSRILAEEGREPRIGELAEACQVSVEEAAMAMDAMLPVASFSDPLGNDEDGGELGDVIEDREDAEQFDHLCERMALSRAIQKLPEDWRRIVMLRYFRNRTQQQVADEMGLSQVKISREEKKIMAFLREEMS